MGRKHYRVGMALIGVTFFAALLEAAEPAFVVRADGRAPTEYVPLLEAPPQATIILDPSKTLQDNVRLQRHLLAMSALMHGAIMAQEAGISTLEVQNAGCLMGINVGPDCRVRSLPLPFPIARRPPRPRPNPRAGPAYPVNSCQTIT